MNSWYWVKIAGVVDLHFLVSASSKDRACFQVAPNSEIVTATVATWGSLEKYLNARIPHKYKRFDIARGSIPIEIGDRQSYIHHSI